MSEVTPVEAASAPQDHFESPPPAPVQESPKYDPKARLHELAMELVRTRNRSLLIEYLRARRMR